MRWIPGSIFLVLLWSAAVMAQTVGEDDSEVGPSKEARDSRFIEPRPLSMVSPSYPDAAVDAALQGSTVVCFSVADDGSVSGAYVLSSTHQMFDEPAVKAATASRFDPAKRDGHPVAHDMCLRYRFRL